MKTIVLSALATLSLSAHAASVVQVGQPVYAGNGCPSGTATFSVSADGQNYILKPSQFAVHTGQDAGKVVDRQSCNVIIPVKVAPGYAVAMVSRISGFVAAEGQGKVTINEELFFAGAQGQKLSKTLINTHQNIQLYSSTSPAKMGFSACGASLNARINLNMLGQSHQTMAAIEDIRFRLVVKKCQ